MYNKNNFAIGKIAHKNRIKPELACVALYGDRTIATDSFRLIEMSATGKKQKVPTLHFADDIKKEVKLKKTDRIDGKDIKVKPAVSGDKYPNIDMILNENKDVEYIEHKVNASFLAEICDILKNLDPFEAVTLRVPTTKYKPMFILAECKQSGKEQTAKALLMPMNR